MTESGTNGGGDGWGSGDSTDSTDSADVGPDEGVGSESSLGLDATSDGSESMGSSNDGASSSDDGPSGCASDDECTEAGNPFCVAGACAPCSAAADPDAACAGKFADTPACVDGECVQCSATVQSACSGTTPLCDVDAHACTGCTSHADCPDSACHIPSPLASRASALDGACFDPTTVVHVAPGGVLDFHWIQQAVDAFSDGEEGVIVLHEGIEHAEIVTVDGGRSIAILAAPGESPQWLGPDSTGPHLLVTGASTVVFLDRMNMHSNYGLAGAAVQAQTGRLHIQRSVIVENGAGAVALQNSAYAHIENSFLGGDQANQTALAINDSDATVLYSTLIAGTGASARSLACTNPNVVDVRNSILLGQAPEPSVECAGASFLNNGSDQGLGLGNATVADFGVSGNSWLADETSGDFHLNFSGAMQFCLVGVWETGDPPTDIDGDARPSMNAAPDCAGADVQ